MRQYLVTPVGPFHVADGAAYANATALTDVAPTPAVLLSANLLELGTRFEIQACGRYSNTGTPTLTLGLYSGTVGQAIGSGVALCVTSALTTVSAAANRTWEIHGRFSVRSVGASGTVFGRAKVSNVTTGATDLAPASAPTTATIDTTVARYMTIGATWGTASASNTLTVQEFGLTMVN